MNIFSYITIEDIQMYKVLYRSVIVCGLLFILALGALMI